MLRDIYNLFFPKVCAVCAELLPEGSDFICTSCQWEIPLTEFWNEVDNPMVHKFAGHLPVVNCCAFFYFVNHSQYQQFIHSFKYRGNWMYAEKAGRWFGNELSQSALYKELDVVIPVPLHMKKLLRRGYNQAEYIARGISEAMNLPLDLDSVKRKINNPSQASLPSKERWDSVAGVFSLSSDSKERLQGKHILLVDDVLTTGATIISCGETILRSIPDCRLSIATLSVSHSSLKETHFVCLLNTLHSLP